MKGLQADKGYGMEYGWHKAGLNSKEQQSLHRREEWAVQGKDGYDSMHKIKFCYIRQF